MQAAIIPVTPFQQNCTLMWCRDTMQGAFVDPGGEVDRLLAVAEDQGVTPVKILLTHGHMDHAGGVAEMVEHLGIPVEGPHADDKFWIDQIEAAAAKYGMGPGPRPFTPDRWLVGGDTVDFGNVTLEVRHCPGHTPGHVIFFHDGLKLAQVGDVLFRGSIGRTDFPRGDHATLIESIRTQLWPLGEDVTFIPGHGPASTFGEELRTNPFVADR
ncbi:MAG: MBL fold metallo-hydrolase [Rhodospirillaceae bacterium]